MKILSLTLYSNQCVSKIAKNFDIEDDTKLAYEVQKYEIHVRQGTQTAFVFFFSENIFYSNQTFLCLDFSQFSL